MKHLRHHPNFVPLPPAETIKELQCLEDVRLFRQESWQWDALHEGRCTTSQAVAALGFLEPKTGKALGVPQSWQRGGVGAYHRLKKTPIRTLSAMNARLCVGTIAVPLAEEEIEKESKTLWAKPERVKDKPFPFAAKYMVRISEEDRKQRRKAAKQNPYFDGSVRMLWGDAQEATALLTALNYFWLQDDTIVIKEVGMCGGGLAFNQTGIASLLVGATPDALICYPDGTLGTFRMLPLFFE
jgi:hypothetical protein